MTECGLYMWTSRFHNIEQEYWTNLTSKTGHWEMQIVPGITRSPQAFSTIWAPYSMDKQSNICAPWSHLVSQVKGKEVQLSYKYPVSLPHKPTRKLTATPWKIIRIGLEVRKVMDLPLNIQTLEVGEKQVTLEKQVQCMTKTTTIL